MANAGPRTNGFESFLFTTATRPGWTASTPSSVGLPTGWMWSTRSRRRQTDASDRPLEAQLIERVELSE